eukprot:TRINITY_DN15432_c0_g1_i1.p1 TRINITY_DN15432_c0_g1~~TRINITY_DN15432_c0_g1_i1.p1  ORF type:complete len:1071 (+),score=254.82 TRINITY_DN15432_c0_g1_i1:52-3213(+)
MAAAPRGRRSLPRGSVAYSPPRWQTEGPRTEVWDTKWPPPDAALLPRPEDPSGVLQGEEGATEALAMIERAPPSGWFTVKRELSDTLELPRAAALVDEGGCVLPGTDLSVRYVGDDGDDVEFRIEGGAIHYKQGDHRSPPFRFLEWTLRGAEGVQVGSFVLKDIGRRIVVTLGRPALGEMLAKLRLLADVANVQHNIGDAVEVRREKKSTLREIPVGYSAVGTVARSEVKWYPMGSRPHDPPLPGQRKELAAAADLASLDHQQRQASRNADQIFRIAGVPLLETSATLIVVPPAVLPVWLRGLGQRHPQLSFSRYEPPPQSAIHTRSVNSHIAAAPPASLTALPVEGPQSDVDVAARGIGGVRIVLISHAALQREVDAARLAVEQTRTPIGQLASPILRLRWWRVCVDLTDPQGVVSREARHVTDLARCVPAVHRWQVHPRGDQLAPAIQYSSSLATQAAKRKEQKSRFQAAVWTMEQVDHRERGDRWRAEDAARAALAEEEKRCRDLVTLLLLDRGSYAPVPKRWGEPAPRSPTTRRWFDLLRAGERTLKHYPGDWDGKFNYVVTQELPRWRRRQQVRRGRAAMARVEAERFGSATRQAAEELFLITGQVQEKEDRAEMESAADDWCIRAHLCCSLLGGALAARVPTQSDEQSRWKRLMRSERNLNGRFYMCYLERVAREEVLLLEWQWLERLQREASEGTSRISEAEEEEVAYLYLRWDLRRHQDRWLVEREDLDERDAADVLREETWQRLGAEGAESCGRAELLHSARMWWQSAVVCWWAERVRIEQRDWLRLRGSGQTARRRDGRPALPDASRRPDAVRSPHQMLRDGRRRADLPSGCDGGGSRGQDVHTRTRGRVPRVHDRRVSGAAEGVPVAARARRGAGERGAREDGQMVLGHAEGPRPARRDAGVPTRLAVACAVDGADEQARYGCARPRRAHRRQGDGHHLREGRVQEPAHGSQRAHTAAAAVRTGCWVLSSDSSRRGRCQPVAAPPQTAQRGRRPLPEPVPWRRPPRAPASAACCRLGEGAAAGDGRSRHARAAAPRSAPCAL